MIKRMLACRLFVGDVEVVAGIEEPQGCKVAVYLCFILQKKCHILNNGVHTTSVG